MGITVQPLSTSELLHAWEAGIGHSPHQRALFLLRAACPELSMEALGELSIGERDDLLLKLREWTFGSRLISVAMCPSCQERVEMEFQIDDIRVSPSQAEKVLITTHQYTVQFRLPNSLDLMAVAGMSPKKEARRQLLERCILNLALLDPHTEKATVLPAALPDSVEQELVNEIARRNAQSDVKLNLNCPACGCQWKMTFDILTFFWEEVNHWSLQTLGEIHQLALAYGWGEADILALSPQRRHLYLEMVGR